MTKPVQARACILGALMASCSGAAMAADSTAASTAAEPAPMVGEIIVTAQKRSESINKVGMAIAALSGDAMKDQNIRTVADLSQVVPGLTYAPSLLDTPVYTLRGVGLYETTLSAYPDVSVYVDQVPLPLPVLTSFVGLDLERVEVLKGPQGVLFGQNSTGGAINYIAAKPTDTPKAGLDVGYGRFDDFIADGFVSGPLTDTLRARLSFEAESAGPWQHSYFMPVGGMNGAVSRQAARLLLDWTPTSKLKLELNVNAGIDRSEPVAPQYIGFSLQQVPASGPGPNGRAIEAYPFAPNDARAADFSNNNKPSSNNPQFQISLRGDYEITDDLTLTSITSYAHYDRNERVEFGGIALEDEELTRDTGSVTSVFQELRIANSPSHHVRWVLGANYEHGNVWEYQIYAFPGSTAPDLTGLTSTPFYSKQEMNNYAAFGNVDWDINRQLTIEGGVRYTESDRHGQLCTLGGDGGGVDALIDSLMAAFHPGVPITPLSKTDCITLDPVTLFSVRQGFIADLNQSNVSARGNLNYKPTENVLLYVNVTKGYKAGGFPMLSASTSFQYLPVVQESVVDYEGGFKISLFDHRLQLDGSGFHYDYTNKQIRTQTVQPIFGILNNLQNVPKSTVDGGELDIAWLPIRGLRIAASGTYLNAKVVKFVGTNADGIRQDYAGAAVPYTPKYSSNYSVDYRWDLSSRLAASVGATVTQRSVSFATIGPAPIDRLPPYVLLDLRAALSTQDNRYRVEIWGKNITNKFYWDNVSHPYDTVVRYAGMPVTYGVTFSARF